MKNKKAVVLLSGGMDSATALYIAKACGYKCSCLSFDYGQKNRRELYCAKKIARKAGCGFKLIRFSLPWGGSSLLDRAKKIPRPKKPCSGNIPTTYVPARNTIFLSFALSFAEASGSDALFIGAHTEDYAGYPDCRPAYFKAFKKAAALGTKKRKKVKIVTPLLHDSKAEIIKKGIKLGVPYEITHSCYKGMPRPCGKCASCLYRARGFREACLKDPIYAKG